MEPICGDREIYRCSVKGKIELIGLGFRYRNFHWSFRELPPLLCEGYFLELHKEKCLPRVLAASTQRADICTVCLHR